jgi:hypothetical protein
MIRLASDLHIHSCLSPCGEEEMTPNNIANMAALKGLDVIALCDHNSTRNLPAVASVCDRLGILFVPGIEVQSREDVHLLCYFPTLDEALSFGSLMEASLPKTKNRPFIFGAQTVRDQNDGITGEVDVMLVQSVHHDIKRVYEICVAHGGLCVPAHINRRMNGLLYTLGFIPDDPPFTAVEIRRNIPMPDIDLGGRHVLYSSDAHQLCDIAEATNFIELEDRSVRSFLNRFGLPDSR